MGNKHDDRSDVLVATPFTFQNGRTFDTPRSFFSERIAVAAIHLVTSLPVGGEPKENRRMKTRSTFATWSAGIVAAVALHAVGPGCGSSVEVGQQTGAGGAAVSPDPLAGVGTTTSQLVRLAVLFSSCPLAAEGVQEAFRSPSSSFSLFENTSPVLSEPASRAAALACLEEKGTTGCAVLNECLGVSIQKIDQCSSKDNSFRGSCDGDVVVSCEAAINYRLDCARGGQVCRDGACVNPTEPPAASCSNAPGESYCEQNRVTTCRDGKVDLQKDCTLEGLICQSKTEMIGTVTRQTASCVGTGPACTVRVISSPNFTSPRGLRCEDASLVECVGEKEFTTECAQTAPGATCQQAPNNLTGQPDYFCGVTAECNPWSWQASCDGDNLKVCVSGKIEAVPCTSWGFTGCGTRNSSRSFDSPRCIDQVFLDESQMP